MKLPVSRQSLPFWTTVAVLIVLYGASCIAFTNFFTFGRFAHFIIDGAMVGVTAIGMTFVILSGGIDLSVGSVIGLSGIVVATLVERYHVHPIVAMTVGLLIGLIVGTTQGALIHGFGLQPFLVTLAGLYFCNGLALHISEESIAVDHPFYEKLQSVQIHYGRTLLFPMAAYIFLGVLTISMYVAKFRPFGRYVYAIGGSEQSASLMGLPVGRTKIAIYALSGFLAALAGVVATITGSAGNANIALGLELNAIAAVVVGGTLLTGGVGYLAGTFVGVMIFAIISTGINQAGGQFSNPAWPKIATGLLLLVFILLQKVLQRKAA